MSRHLGIDYGTVRIGVALSDPFGEFASPHDVIKVRGRTQAIADIVALCEEHDVETIVVGKPLNMDGTHSAMTDEALSFAAVLASQTSAKVETWDERMSSMGAEREMIAADLSRKKRKEKIDKLAAQSILQSFLDAKRFKEGDGLDF